MNLEILDFDGSIANQSKLLSMYSPILHSREHWAPRIRMGCSFGRFRKFTSEIPPSNAPRLSFLGSGDFHHVTLALLAQLKTPFHLVSIDKHPDWVRHMPIMHCGTWIAHALKLPMLKSIYHFGGDLDFDNYYRHLAPWEALQSGRVRVFPSHRRYLTGGWKKLPHEPLRESLEKLFISQRFEQLLEPYKQEISEYPLYITLDKDALLVEDAVVNWDSGILHLSEIENLLRSLKTLSGKPLIGADILGDWSPVRMSGLMRKMLDWSEHPALKIDPVKAREVNERTNLRLVEVFRS